MFLYLVSLGFAGKKEAICFSHLYHSPTSSQVAATKSQHYRSLAVRCSSRMSPCTPKHEGDGFNDAVLYNGGPPEEVRALCGLKEMGLLMSCRTKSEETLAWVPKEILRYDWYEGTAPTHRAQRCFHQRRKDDSSRGWTRVPPRISAQLAATTPPDTTTSTTPMAVAITPSSSPALLLLRFRSAVRS